MCLTNNYSNLDLLHHVRKPDEWVIGYKVVLVARGRICTPFRFATIPMDKQTYSTKSSRNAHLYKTFILEGVAYEGIHFFTERDAARDLKRSNTNLRIVKVYAKVSDVFGYNAFDAEAVARSIVWDFDDWNAMREEIGLPPFKKL